MVILSPRRGYAFATIASLLLTAPVPSAALAAEGQAGQIAFSSADRLHTTADSDPRRASSSFTISGALRDEEEHPVRDAVLAVYLDPGPAMLLGVEPAAGISLAAARTTDQGEFELRVPALRDITAYLDEDGNVTLLFMSFGERHTLMHHQQVTLPTAGGQPVRPVLTGSAEVSFPEVQGSSLVGMVLPATTVPAGQEEGGVGTQSLESDACTRVWSPTPWGNYYWVREGSAFRRWVPVQRAQTGNKTNMTYEWGNTQSTSVEVAVNFEYNKTAGKAGWSKTISNSAGVNFNVGYNVVRDLEVEYDFYNYRLWCSISGDTTNRRDAKVTKALPYQFKGGNRNSSYTGYYTCPNTSYRIEISNQLWVSRSATTTISGNLSIYGVSLSGSQANTSSHKKTYTPKSTPARLCGYNANPTVTEKVSEVA